MNWFRPLAVTACTMTTAAGAGRQATLEALRARRSGLRPCRFSPFGEPHELPTWTGEIDAARLAALPPSLQAFDCRNNRLAHDALQRDGVAEATARAVARWGAHRVAVVAGTSTSGLLQGEWAYTARDADGRLPAGFRYAETLNANSLPRLLARLTGARGPSYAVSTACSSGAKVFGAAARLVMGEQADAVLVAGVDTQCLTTLHGFNALELLSPRPCRPFDRDRDGISLGEGAGFALLERDRGDSAAMARLVGFGDSSDAHHMSAPHPTGLGAELAMRQALGMAGLAPADIGYVNLHGTATRANDEVEAMAVHRVLGERVPTSSTKGWTGHLLGAAGIVEAVIAIEALRCGLLPGTLNLVEQDPQCRIHVLGDNLDRSVDFALSNSFGFGGSNSSLLFGRID